MDYYLLLLLQRIQWPSLDSISTFNHVGFSLYAHIHIQKNLSKSLFERMWSSCKLLVLIAPSVCSTSYLRYFVLNGHFFPGLPCYHLHTTHNFHGRQDVSHPHMLLRVTGKRERNIPVQWPLGDWHLICYCCPYSLGQS